MSETIAEAQPERATKPTAIHKGELRRKSLACSRASSNVSDERLMVIMSSQLRPRALPERPQRAPEHAASMCDGAHAKPDSQMNEPSAQMPLLLVAAVALIDADNRVLIAQRPAGKTMAGLWEFPGGKVEGGERPEETLIRELDEELGITVKEDCLAPLTFASHTYEDFHLLLPLYACRRWGGFVQARERQALRWVRARSLSDYPMPPADAPLVPALIDLLG